MIIAKMKPLDRYLMAATLLITLVSTFLMTGYTHQKKREMTIQSTLFQKQMKEMNLADRNLLSMKRFLDDTQKELHLLNERIPEEGSIGKFLDQLDEMMESHRMKLISVRPLIPIYMKPFLKVPIQLKVKGEFVPMLQMLNALEQMNRLVMLEKMSMKKIPKDSLLMLDLSIGVFEKKKD